MADYLHRAQEQDAVRRERAEAFNETNHPSFYDVPTAERVRRTQAALAAAAARLDQEEAA